VGSRVTSSPSSQVTIKGPRSSSGSPAEAAPVVATDRPAATSTATAMLRLRIVRPPLVFGDGRSLAVTG
jgi:hypothetical protein